MTDLPDLTQLFKPHGHDGPCGLPLHPPGFVPPPPDPTPYKRYLVTIRGDFYGYVLATDEDSAWSSADDMDPEDMHCTNWEVLNVDEVIEKNA